MTVGFHRSPVPPHTGAYTHKRPRFLQHPDHPGKAPPAPSQAKRPDPFLAHADPPGRPVSAPSAIAGTRTTDSPGSGADASTPPSLQCTSSKCAFCLIALGASPADILCRDGDLMVIRDHRPAAEHHYLVVALNHHSPDPKHLTPADLPLLRRMEVLGLQVLEDQGAPVGDLRMGFHIPPFQSMNHLHLHCIAPASTMGYFSRAVAFRPDSFCFVTIDRIVAKLLCAP